LSEQLLPSLHDAQICICVGLHSAVIIWWTDEEGRPSFSESWQPGTSENHTVHTVGELSSVCYSCIDTSLCTCFTCQLFYYSSKPQTV